MTCPHGRRGIVDLGSFLCDPELSSLLVTKGVWGTLRARLAQAEDLEGFMAELTDVLDKVRETTTQAGRLTGRLVRRQGGKRTDTEAGRKFRTETAARVHHGAPTRACTWIGGRQNAL